MDRLRRWLLRGFQKDAEAFLADREAGYRVRTQLLHATVDDVRRRMLELEGKIAALQATHHQVHTVPVDALRAMKEEDITQMTNVSEKMKEDLREILALQESLNAAQNAEAMPEV